MLRTLSYEVGEAIKGLKKPRMADQSELYADILINHLRAIGNSLYRTERMLGDEEVCGDLRHSIFNTLVLLSKEAKYGNRFIFCGSSTEVSTSILKAACEDRPDFDVVKTALESAIHLNTQENLELRSSSNIFKLPINSTIIDEYALSMTKARDLIRSMLNRRKVVVFAVQEFSRMDDLARTYFLMYSRLGRFKFGMASSKLISFFEEITHATTSLRSIQQGGPIYKNTGVETRHYWNTSLINNEDLKTLKQHSDRHFMVMQKIEDLARTI